MSIHSEVARAHIINYYPAIYHAALLWTAFIAPLNREIKPLDVVVVVHLILVLAILAAEYNT